MAMNTVTWKAEVRHGSGKEAAHKARAAGKIPVVAYGRDIPNVKLAVNAEALEIFMRNKNWPQALINLEIEGAPELKDKVFMIREMQRHHVSWKPLAIDLLAIRLDQKIKFDVPVEVLGAAEVRKQGGVMEILHRTLPIWCLPTAIPEKIVVDASMLELGHTLHLADIALPEGVVTDLPKDYPLCTALTTRAEEEAPKAAAEGAEGAEAAEGAEGAAAEGEEKKEGAKKPEEKKEVKKEKK